MDVSLAGASDPTVAFDKPQSFRVRHAVQSPDSWLVDDYDVTGANDVTEVIEWARTAFAEGLFQVYLRYEIMSEGPDGWSPEAQFAHLYGEPLVLGAATEIVTSSSR
jgi:hypothetical protein